MIYLISLKKYFVTFLKVLLFIMMLLLIYLFYLIMVSKYAGSSNFIKDGLKNYFSVVLLSLPFILTLSTALFSGVGVTFDKIFLLRLMPVIAATNAILLVVFFVVKIDFKQPPEKSSYTFIPEIQQGYINPLNNYNLYVHNLTAGKIREGMLFYKQTYFISSGTLYKKSVTIHSKTAIGKKGVYSTSTTYSIPTQYIIWQMKGSDITSFIIDNYFKYIRKIKHVFQTTFLNNGLITSIVSIFLMSIGYFSFISAICYFFDEKKIFILTISGLTVIGFLAYIGMPHILGLVEVIKLGIKNPFFQIFLPSLMISVLLGLMTLGLMTLKDLIIKRQRGQIV